MKTERLRPSFTFDEDRIEELKTIAPEAFADGKINWDVLHAALGDNLETETADTEHFGLFWPGKREARRLASIPSTGTLEPVKSEGINDAQTHNVFIEGDNLEVVKLLKKSYAERVKMIYIDPPYNTGNDFIYADDFKEPLELYFKKTGQSSEDGILLTTNPKSAGSFHSNWLNMMYPRLSLARQLLREDGVIFVSINDNEVTSLRILMNEIFGEENFVGQLTWKNKYGAGAKTKGFIVVHEYIVCYSKSALSNIESPMSEEELSQYKNKDEKYETRGGYVTQPLATTSLGDRPNLKFPILYKGKEIWPEKQWVWEKTRVQTALDNNELVIRESNDGKFSVRFKQYAKDEHGKNRRGKPLSILNGPFTQEGTEEISTLFGDKAIFDFPKPSSLIKYLFSFLLNEQDEKSGLYLDLFAGSCTSAQSILQLNQEDGGNRVFIMVQLPEPTPKDSVANKAGYPTIADIGKDRIRRVIGKIEKENTTDVRTGHESQDLGFKVFKLNRSNYKAWQDYHGEDIKQLEMLFDGAETPLREGWTPESLLTEVMLVQGFPLDSSISVLPECKQNELKIVTATAIEHRLITCLDEKIREDTLTHLKFNAGDIFVCLDSAMTDQAKMRLANKCILRTI